MHSPVLPVQHLLIDNPQMRYPQHPIQHPTNNNQYFRSNTAQALQSHRLVSPPVDGHGSLWEKKKKTAPGALRI